MKIGLIGCGAIGQFLIERINKEKSLENTEIVAVLDERTKSSEKLQRLANQYGFEFHQALSSFLQTPLDLVIECANIQTVNDYAPAIVKKKDFLIISIGALADQSFYEQLVETSKEYGRKIYLPTGAIGGLDLIKAANSMDGLEKVSLISRKPAKALEKEALAVETTLFKGNAKQAINKFPKNANVAVAISLAGIGTEKTTVHMIADPLIERNIHTIQLEGDFGKAEFSIQNNPSPDNPKTSYLTALSILSAIRSLDEQIVIG